jgi:ubiquinone/menaquinone biosynthesis C-methylase UbiE
MVSTQQNYGPHHDWQSAAYVGEWVAGDVQKDAQRRPILERMLALSGIAPDAQIEVLDIGAGYGIVTSLVLEKFPKARVTLQDFSAPMLDQARQRLNAAAERLTFVQSDLRDAGWSKSVGGPFDLAVSAIAIHNLGEPAQMAAVYRGVHDLLKPKGVFLDCDYTHTAKLEQHIGWLRDAGFVRAESPWQADALVIMAAYKAKTLSS